MMTNPTPTGESMKTELQSTWITSAIAAGGVLTVSGPLIGNRMVRAEMTWADEPGYPRLYGELKLSVLDALNSLDSALQEDAANEMTEKGAA